MTHAIMQQYSVLTKLLIMLMLALFRDYTGANQAKKLRNEAVAAGSNQSDTIELISEGENNDKVDSTNCLFSQCLIL
jgi:hypothetical protein